MGCCGSSEANAVETELPMPEWGKPFKCRLKKKGMFDAIKRRTAINPVIGLYTRKHTA